MQKRIAVLSNSLLHKHKLLSSVFQIIQKFFVFFCQFRFVKKVGSALKGALQALLTLPFLNVCVMPRN